MKKLLWLAVFISLIMASPAFAENMFEKMKSSAEAGDAVAQYKLAMEYYNGDYFPKDLKKCAEWCEKSAAQGYAGALMQLGVLYTYGEGVPKDLKKAFELEEKAAVQGYDVAQFGLGGKYIRGEGVARDPKKAVEWLEKAAAQGNLGALNGLALAYYEGKTAGIPKDAVRAYAYFELSIKNGDKKEQTAASMNGLLKTMSKTQADEARKMSKDILDKIENNRKNHIKATPARKVPANVPPPPIVEARGNDNQMKKDIGASVPAGANFTWKPFKMALSNKKIEDLKLLLEKGVDLKFTNQNGENCIFQLTAGVIGGDNDEKSAVMAGMLVEKGAEVNVKNKFGQTALMMAAKYGNVPLMKFLVEKGAEVNARSDKGMTALGYAKNAGQEESVKYLVSVNAAE